MIQLYDHYHQASRDLHYSLTQAGYEGTTLVVNDDGFLPEGVTSPYAYFCQMTDGEGQPLHFNQIPVPEGWEIRGTNANAEVWDYATLRAKIFYAEPKHRRWVKAVDWLTLTGQVTMTEHFNQFGWRFATTLFTKEQKPSIKSYFNRQGQEILVENFLTGDIILNWQGQTHIFANRVAFLKFYLTVTGADLSSMVYNSLSVPFFLSYQLADKGKDILFWQEEIGDSLPGNMQTLLNHPTTRTQKIIVQNRQTYDKLMALATPDQQEKISYLGLIYPERRSNGGSKNILIFTNSDQIEHLEKLTSELTEFHFHIAALTEMSDKLTAYGQKTNVSLYPNATEDYLNQLYQTCDIFLDINRGNEVLNANRRAFEHNQLILGFTETRHRTTFGLAENFVSLSAVGQLLAKLTQVDKSLDSLLTKQRSGQATAADYRNLLET